MSQKIIIGQKLHKTETALLLPVQIMQLYQLLINYKFEGARTYHTLILRECNWQKCKFDN